MISRKIIQAICIGSMALSFCIGNAHGFIDIKDQPTVETIDVSTFKTVKQRKNSSIYELPISSGYIYIPYEIIKNKDLFLEDGEFNFLSLGHSIGNWQDIFREYSNYYNDTKAVLGMVGGLATDIAEKKIKKMPYAHFKKLIYGSGKIEQTTFNKISKNLIKKGFDSIEEELLSRSKGQESHPKLFTIYEEQFYHIVAKKDEEKSFLISQVVSEYEYFDHSQYASLQNDEGFKLGPKVFADPNQAKTALEYGISWVNPMMNLSLDLFSKIYVKDRLGFVDNQVNTNLGNKQAKPNNLTRFVSKMIKTGIVKATNMGLQMTYSKISDYTYPYFRYYVPKYELNGIDTEGQSVYAGVVNACGELHYFSL